MIGITCSIDDRRAYAGLGYADRVAEAGGVPVLLPPMGGGAIGGLIERMDGFVFSGGDDPAMEGFGVATHPEARVMPAARQAFEVGLLRGLAEVAPEKPVLGVCLGMQLMALVAGGGLDQHMPDGVATADQHVGDREHGIVPEGGESMLTAGVVTSHHHQAVSDAGSMRVVARSPDGVIEAIADPGRWFYLGVQWHPERTGGDALGAGLFRRLVHAAALGPSGGA